MRWCNVMHGDDVVIILFFFSEVIFTPSGTLMGPSSALPMIPAQNMSLLADVAALLGHAGHPPTVHYSNHLDHPGLHSTHQ